MVLIPVLPDEIEIGRPLACALRDAQGEVLYSAGEAIPADGLADALRQGLFREEAQPPQAAPGFAEAPAGTVESSARLQLTPGDAIQLSCATRKTSSVIRSRWSAIWRPSACWSQRLMPMASYCSCAKDKFFWPAVLSGRTPWPTAPAYLKPNSRLSPTCIWRIRSMCSRCGFVNRRARASTW
ncbi:hypothetical protein D3C84_782070 [compost metagenome]